jgi:galactose mutarotase-like enzyme
MEKLITSFEFNKNGCIDRPHKLWSDVVFSLSAVKTEITDVVLGFDNLVAKIISVERPLFLLPVGRFAGRINNGVF